jgi:hypothetical protein
MAYQNKRGIPLAHGQYLRNGQVIGPAATIANTSTKAKPGVVARSDDGCVIAPRADNIALSGAPKNSGAVPVMPGMRNRSGE